MDKIEVENVNSPQHKVRVDAAKYHEMRRACLAVLPDAEPGMTPAALILAVKPLLSQEIFPEGKTAGWWMKCVQLDLEAKGILRRAAKAPVRLWKV
jgi:hypothetical protein